MDTVQAEKLRKIRGRFEVVVKQSAAKLASDGSFMLERVEAGDPPNWDVSANAHRLEQAIMVLYVIDEVTEIFKGSELPLVEFPVDEASDLLTHPDIDPTPAMEHRLRYHLTGSHAEHRYVMDEVESGEIWQMPYPKLSTLHGEAHA